MIDYTKETDRVIFVSGIDTDAGKTYATAFLADMMADRGLKVITQKFIQTGCVDSSEDIERHRSISGISMLPEDISGLTAPIIFSYPASAQLAARIDGKEIDLNVITSATQKLLENYDKVLIEGAGGLCVPITDTYLAIDYVKEHDLPLVLVTNGRLGSINHTILSLEAVKVRNIRLLAVIYNEYFDTDKVISADTKAFIQRYIARNFTETEYIEMPELI